MMRTLIPTLPIVILTARLVNWFNDFRILVNFIAQASMVFFAMASKKHTAGCITGHAEVAMNRINEKGLEETSLCVGESIPHPWRLERCKSVQKSKLLSLY